MENNSPTSEPIEPIQTIDKKAMPELAPTVLEEIDILVRSAFWNSDSILNIICEELYAPGELDDSLVSTAISSSIKKWQAEQFSWPKVTDCDRLDQALPN